MRQLVAGGCSFTQHDILPTKVDPTITSEMWDFVRWPAHLAKLLSLTPINLGQSGTSNSAISSAIFNHINIHHKDIGLVVVLWTSWHRLNPLDLSICLNPAMAYNIAEMDNPNFDKDRKMHSILKDTTSWNKEHFVNDVVLHNIKQFFCVESICKKYSIPYIFMQGIHPIDCIKEFWDTFFINNKRVLQSITKYEQWFDYSRFVGWPIYHEMGGFYVNNMNCPMSTKDAHPNEIGHKKIAQQFLGEINVRRNSF
jgi:hypothetical protein